MIIGIAGRKGHGKDAIGLHLQFHHAFTTLAFADSLKQAAQVIFRLSDGQLYGTTFVKERVDERWGKSPREILQLLGTEVGRNIDPDVWVKSTKAKIDEIKGQGNQHFAITDVRFPNEAAAVEEWGGKIIKVVRPGFDTFTRNEHASETEVDNIKPDVVIYNDGTLAQLHEAVRRMLANWEVDLDSYYEYDAGDGAHRYA